MPDPSHVQTTHRTQREKR